MVIKTVEEIEQLKKTIISNADTAYEQLKVRTLDLPAIVFLAEVKPKDSKRLFQAHAQSSWETKTHLFLFSKRFRRKTTSNL